MGWVNDALKKLADGEEVQVRPFGGSMRGRIESGQLVTLAPVQPNDVCVEDVVLVRWQGNYLLHIVKEIKDGRFLIGNNVGKINGWVSAEDIMAKVVEIGEPLNLARQVGIVEAMEAGSQCLVRLFDGERVTAFIPKDTLRDMFRIVSGDHVQVSGPHDGTYRVLGFAKEHSEATPGDRPLYLE
jgi:translation initiation factor IF-1